MSTSPSWFDKQKFSALVKQVGPKRPVDPMAQKKRAIEPLAAPRPALAKRLGADAPAPREPTPGAHEPMLVGHETVAPEPPRMAEQKSEVPAPPASLVREPTGEPAPLTDSAPEPDIIFPPILGPTQPTQPIQPTQPTQLPEENVATSARAANIVSPKASPGGPEVPPVPPLSELQKGPDVAAELAEAHAAIEQLTQERRIGRGEVSILRGQMAQMEEAVKDRETLAMQLLEALQALEERNERQAAHEAKHGELQAAHEALQEKHGALQAALTELQARVAEIQAKREELQARSTDFQVRHDELQGRCNDLQMRNDELRAKYDDLQLRHEELSERAAGHQRAAGQLDEQVLARKESQEEAAHLRERLAENEEASARKQETLAKLNQELLDSNENLQGQMFRLMQEGARLAEIPQLEEESHRLRDTLQRREAEVFDLRQTQSGTLEIIDSLKFEINRLNEEVAAVRAQGEAAQQGLTSSQKTLQETRDALREASQNSANRGMLENLQRECSTLVQQNMLLQAQLDQLQRELSAARAKAASGRS